MDGGNAEKEGQSGTSIHHEQGLDIIVPELKITQVLRSEKPLLDIKPNTPMTGEMCRIQPVGEYTIALARGSDVIKLFDNNGRLIEDFACPTMIVNWPKLKKQDEAYIFMHIDSKKVDKQLRDSSKSVIYFPDELQNFLVQLIRQDRGDDNMLSIPAKPDKIETSRLEQISVVVKPGFVIIFQPETKNYITLQTQNDQGIDLQPRNWKRFDFANQLFVNQTEKIPQKIEQEVKNLGKDASTTTTQTANDYHVITLPDRLDITITKPGQDPGVTVFTDKIASIDKNVCEDPKDRGIIYYCSSNNPRAIVKLDTTKALDTWRPETIDLPGEYKKIRNLRLDPTGNFFVFQADADFVILAKDTLQEVKKIPKLYEGTLDKQGRITGVDEKGYLVVYDANFQEFTRELEKGRVARLAKGLAADLFQPEAEATKIEVEQFQHFVPVKTDLEAKFATQLQAITSLDDVSTITEALTRLRTRLQSEGLQPTQIEFITRGIQDSITAKERLLAAPIVAQGLVDLNTKLAGNLTIASITEAKGDIAKLKSLEGLVDDATRAKIRALESQFEQQSAELFRREGAVIEKEIGELVTGVSGELEKMMSMPDFADWQEFRLPQLISRLGALANDCPLEASETQKKILAARKQLQELSRQYEAKFKERYALVREKASEVMGARVELIKVDMDSLADRLRARGFKDRYQAESYVRSSEALQALRSEISALVSQDPDASRELDRELKVIIATIMSEVERGGLTTIAETGQQMVLFGGTLFPRWEGRVQEKVQRRVDLVFMPDEKSKGPGVSADKIFGDVGIMEINTRGKLERRRLYEGMQNEDEWRYGSVSYRGEYIFPSYVNQAEYRKIKKDYEDWSREDSSKIKKSLSEKRQALHEWYKQRPRDERDTSTDDQWGAKYRELLGDYSKYAAENHVLLLSRVDRLRKAPETEFANGSGYIPEWQSHWTADETTENYLEKMAQASKMQLDLQEGLLNLKGHAGTGKDVLVKMFCNRSNRPYFAIDCSKWTTEFELSEDVVLEAEDGASKTVKVPSVVLNAITTPGAVMYFNENDTPRRRASRYLKQN